MNHEHPVEDLPAGDATLDALRELVGRARDRGLAVRLSEEEWADLTEDSASELIDELREQLGEIPR